MNDDQPTGTEEEPILRVALETLLELSEAHSRAKTPEESRKILSDYLDLVCGFILDLPGTEEERNTAIIPIRSVIADLASLDSGTTPPRLSRAPKKGRSSPEEMANKAIAAAVIDYLKSRPDVSLEIAAKKVERRMHRHGTISGIADHNTLLRFRRDISSYDASAREIRKAMAEEIAKEPPETRTDFAMSRLSPPYCSRVNPGHADSEADPADLDN